MDIPKDISNLRNHFYSNAERFWWVTFWIAVGTQLLALAAIWINNNTFLELVAFVALAAPIAIAWLREKADATSLKADKCRRLILYAEGLGRPIAQKPRLSQSPDGR